MRQTRPTLSILLPAYNAEAFIGDAIKSILVQQFQNFELLVCDDNSSDNTYQAIQQFSGPRISIFRNETNQGKNKSVEFLLQQAKGDFISIHDADDISLPDRFEKQVSFLESHPSYALCGTNFISFLTNGKIIDRSNLETDSLKIRDRIKKESQFHGPTIVFRKDILDNVGGLYRHFTRAEDIDFTMRVAEKYDTANLPEYLYMYRHVPSSLTNALSGYNLERLGHAKLLYYLANERATTGTDLLMQGNLEKIGELMKEFTAEYQNDPTIALRRGVFRLLGMRMYSNAIQLSFKALTEEFTILNLKCFVYAVLSSIKGQCELFRMKEKVDLKFLQ